MDNSNFTESIAVLCYDFFRNLPKTGKPKQDEWTVLSCIVKSFSDLEPEVVSLGTGSKCIGIHKMSPRGDMLNDSHAEIMARRGFLRYLYEQIELAFKSKTSIFNVAGNKRCTLKPGVRFHLFTSQSPCGDGSIVEGEDGLQFAGGLYLHAVEIGPIKQLQNNITRDKMMIEEHAKRGRSFIECHESKRDDCIPPKKAKSENNKFVPSQYTKNVDSNALPLSMTVNTIVQKNPLPTKKDFSEICSFPYLPNIGFDEKLPKAFSFESNRVDEITQPQKNAILDEIPLSATIEIIADMNSIPTKQNISDNCQISSLTTSSCFDKSSQLPMKTISECFSLGSNTVDEIQRNEDNMLGRVRTKPGKGDPTASLSCSDKIARWLRVGIQGALLSLFLDEPLQLDSIIVGGGCPFSKGALYRALVDRSFNVAYTNQWTALEYTKPVVPDDCNLDLLKVPIVEQSTAVFEFAKREGKTPSSASIVWSKVEYL